MSAATARVPHQDRHSALPYKFSFDPPKRIPEFEPRGSNHSATVTRGEWTLVIDLIFRHAIQVLGAT
ncbi:hypothetical protein M407DRAFT_245530 [Tulasnella calospora MUT 4182]|uniref:Uncharacterized protein n=1 Tax=Tulasnella calospora MUT 4182 TaxID=1051891 RepID=A0A0C3KIB4_9AGAM|nr:hypothetical protein M407DRAFT_246273 [Tulasnella calospora MUT 4182]KIO21238.1 hypothetical protein M407DRAFT_245530 [Tulasnella calospora MUT 4182]